jgi:hypothetical protein
VRSTAPSDAGTQVRGEESMLTPANGGRQLWLRVGEGRQLVATQDEKCERVGPGLIRAVVSGTSRFDAKRGAPIGSSSAGTETAGRVGRSAVC